MAGERIESRCRRCNDITGHVIVAMVGGEIYKVECQACRSVHKFHPATPAAPERRRVSAPAKERASKASTESSRKLADEQAWQGALNQHFGDEKNYAMDAAFSVGDLVVHPSFGKGIVQAVQPPNKMTVLFRDGRRDLRCAV